MQLLAKFRVVSYARASTLRKWVIPTAFIFAALITPSLDGTLTLLVAIPMLLLYEIGLLASWLTHREEGNYFTDLPMVQSGQLFLVWIAHRPVVLVHKIHYKFRDNNKRF
jgi:Sec-independent protein secretion pathway component TatC